MSKNIEEKRALAVSIEEMKIILCERGKEDRTVRCWYLSPPGQPRKWRVIEFGPDDYRIDLGMVGPNYERHGSRYWVKEVWKSRTFEQAREAVERQERPVPPTDWPTP